MTVRILVVDDEPLYLRLLRVNLESEGYEITTAKNGEEALDQISQHIPDLIIMDVMMPKMDGITTCVRIRQFSNVPIILLTALNEEHDRVNGLNIGADDYVTKPFSATELVARVRAVLRRTKDRPETNESKIFVHGNLRIDIAKAEVWRGNQPVYLSATEYKLLLHFAHENGKVLTAEALLAATWGSSYKEEKEILWVSIARLRQKLEDDPHNPVHIVTRTGLGYQMPLLEE
ncbi:MAG: OmpR family two-component response regulator [Chloroflexi bacterium]|nr:MAG: OmpR family two-component response regulator [Chloroflexota bacterium]MBA4375365.1 DNA-binding response regulator [Anaerolinea sp.]